MKRQKLIGIPTLVLLLLVLLVSIAAAAVLSEQQNPVGPFPGPTGVAPDSGATATLIRKTDKVHIKIDTNNLDEGAAYTVWAVNWDDPDKCDGPCDGPDVCAVEGSSVYYATGRVINNNGTARFNAVIHEGASPGELECTGPDTVGGLGNAEGAEIHFAIRTHGQPIPGMVPAQTKTFSGGCDLNECSNQQGVAFQQP